MLNNTSGPAHTTSLSVKAAKASPHEKEIPSLLSAFIPAASESFTYDADGNVTDDGQWDYTWDAENRLVKMETDSVAMGVGLPGKRLVFRYDSLGRRTAKEVWAYSGSWSKTSEVRFVYQGWNLVAELDTLGNRLRTYAWGLDLGGSLTAMGGIGALVQTVDHTGTVASYLPGYDGQGNVAAVMKSDGTIAAKYEYSPFGETLRREGDYAATNPFRSATKYTDDESGLVYYGTRYYSPSLGRFINRDSISEAGGVNLYAFVGNDPVNAWDYLGMDAFLEFNGFKADGGISWVEGDGPTWYTERDRSLAIASRQWGGAPLKSTFKETEEEWEKIRRDRYGSGIPEERKAGNLPGPSKESDKLKTYTWNTGKNRYDPDGEGGVLSLPRYTVYADGHGETDLVGTLGEVFLHTDIYREGAALWRESSRYTPGDRILSRATVVFFFTVGAVDVASNFVSGGGKTAASGAAKGLGKLAAESGAKLTGQIHHGISRQVHKALEQHPNLRGVYQARDPRLITQATDAASHRGYQQWHRNLDAEVAGWVRNNPNATPQQFEGYLRGRYSQPDLSGRFPDGL